MLSVEEFAKKVGVSEDTVLKWIKKELIPGTVPDEETGKMLIPNSARRPYFPRCMKKAAADTIRASIINACIKRRHVSEKTYNMNKGEFEKIIENLEKADLITRRVEDGITYYDSTPKSDEYKGKNTRDICKLLVELLGTLAGKILASYVSSTTGIPVAQP